MGVQYFALLARLDKCVNSLPHSAQLAIICRSEANALHLRLQNRAVSLRYAGTVNCILQWPQIFSYLIRERVVPLIKSTSKQAFKKNVATEAKSKPIKQAVAIAYSVKREAASKKSSPMKKK